MSKILKPRGLRVGVEGALLPESLPVGLSGHINV